MPINQVDGLVRDVHRSFLLTFHIYPGSKMNYTT